MRACIYIYHQPDNSKTNHTGLYRWLLENVYISVENMDKKVDKHCEVFKTKSTSTLLWTHYKSHSKEKIIKMDKHRIPWIRVK